MENQTSVQTNVQQVDLDIDSWLGAPGADSIVTPDKPADAKPNIFSAKGPDLSFLDKDEEEQNEEAEKQDGVDANKDSKGQVSREIVDDIVIGFAKLRIRDR